jgi:hypothetical protein
MRGKPFQKGQSGNPGGRRKENLEFREAAKQYSMESLERLVFWMRSDNPKASIVSAIAILDRAFGKPPQQVEGLLDMTSNGQKIAPVINLYGRPEPIEG